MDWILDRIVDQSHCGASIGNNRVTDPIFANDAVLLVESFKVLVFQVSWPKSKDQIYGGIPNDKA